MDLPFHVGIMQGRLSPKAPEALQSFPSKYWRQEFSRAATIGFTCIEWLFDSYAINNNPLLSHNSQAEITSLQLANDIEINSACAHFIIDGKINADPNSKHAQEARNTLKELCGICIKYNINNIVLPIMDHASVTDEIKANNFRENILDVIKNTKECTFALETDIDAKKSMELLNSISSNRVGLCYDIGNATALGFNISHELPIIINHIKEIHIKDRIRGGGSTLLGLGETPLEASIEQAIRLGYQGNFILETPVGPDWEVSARHNFNIAQKILAKLVA